MPAVDLERQLGRAGAGGQAALGEIVAVQRAGDDARLAGQLQIGLQACGQPGAAGPDADQRGVGPVGEQAAHAVTQRAVERFGIESQ